MNILKTVAKQLPPIKRIQNERDYLRSILKNSGSGYELPLANAIAKGQHRQAIGGLWEELGKLQFDFMRSQGLMPHHQFLDIGCGSLRGGVKFIAYLESGHYWGIDNSAELLNLGWEKELYSENLQSRQPKNQLVYLGDFEFYKLEQSFDFALAQSVFTHLNFNKIRRCLDRLASVMKAGGKFYATFLEAPLESQLEKPMERPRCTSYSDRDPFHYRFEDFQYAIKDMQWELSYIGQWNHPADTRVLLFERHK